MKLSTTTFESPSEAGAMQSKIISILFCIVILLLAGAELHAQELFSGETQSLLPPITILREAPLQENLAEPGLLAPRLADYQPLPPLLENANSITPAGGVDPAVFANERMNSRLWPKKSKS